MILPEDIRDKLQAAYLDYSPTIKSICGAYMAGAAACYAVMVPESVSVTREREKKIVTRRLKRSEEKYFGTE